MLNMLNTKLPLNIYLYFNRMKAWLEWHIVTHMCACIHTSTLTYKLISGADFFAVSSEDFNYSCSGTVSEDSLIKQSHCHLISSILCIHDFGTNVVCIPSPQKVTA